MISLITYTYNDHDYVTGLLKSVCSWSVLISEAIIVDDASKEPFSLSIDLPYSTTVVRLDSNVGPGMVKHYGVEASKGKILFSLDADIRPHAKWLEHTLPFLLQEQVGIVGTEFTPVRGKDCFSRAQHKIFTPQKKDKEVVFLSGGCLLLLKSTWDTLGGIKEYKREGYAYEDIYLSAKARAHGFALIESTTYPVYGLRNLDRKAHCRRQRAYMGAPITAVIKKHGIEQYIADVEQSLQTALAYMDKYKDPILVYVFFLCAVSHIAFSGRDEEIPFCEEQALAGAIALFIPFPKALAFLKEDLVSLGHTVPLPSDFLPYEKWYFALAKALPALEETWVDCYCKEDQEASFDFHYLSQEK